MTAAVFGRLLRSSLHRDLAYRSAFVFSLLGSLIWIAVFAGTYAVIYTQVQSLSGYSFDQAMVYFATFTLVEQLLHALFSRSLPQLPRMIHRGELDMVLTKPVDAQLAVSLSRVSLLDLVKCIAPAVLLGVFLARAPELFSWWYVPLLLLAIAGCYALWFLVVGVAFYASQLSSLSEFFSTSLRMLQFPPQIYLGAMRAFLYVAFPLAPLVLLPATSVLAPERMAVVAASGAALVVLLLLLSRVFWLLGLRRYASAS